MSQDMRIAVVGAGMSGLTAARVLHGAHNVTLFETTDAIGGNAQTMRLPNEQGELVPVDTGVCMFFTSGYPNFYQLLRKLGVPSTLSDVNAELLSIPDQQRYFFDLNAPLKTVAAAAVHQHQRWFVRDGFQFYRHALRALKNKDRYDETLGDHLESGGYSELFRLFISFVCGGTWTLYHRAVCEVPFVFVARILKDLGFLPAVRSGVWHCIPGSVARYLNALANPMSESIRLGCTVNTVERRLHGVSIYGHQHGDEFEQEFDHVILAIPAKRALSLIADPTPEEAEVLGVFETKDHEVVFTSDESLANSWKSETTAIFAATDVIEQSMERDRDSVFRVGFVDVTRMNRLKLAHPLYMWYQFPEAPRPHRVHKRILFSTPVFTKESLMAQDRHVEISGRDRLHFCSTGWTNGIHEGAVTSAINVTKWFGRDLADL